MYFLLRAHLFGIYLERIIDWKNASVSNRLKKTVIFPNTSSWLSHLLHGSTNTTIYMYSYCVFPENILTHPTEDNWKSLVEGEG